MREGGGKGVVGGRKARRQEGREAGMRTRGVGLCLNHLSFSGVFELNRPCIQGALRKVW